MAAAKTAKLREGDKVVTREMQRLLHRLREAKEKAEAWQQIRKAPRDRRLMLGWWQQVEGRMIFVQVVGEWTANLNHTGRGAWTDYSVGSWGYEEFAELKPTHWRELPPPPAFVPREVKP